MKLWRTERVRDRVEGASGERFRRKDQRCHGDCLHHHQFFARSRRMAVVLVPVFVEIVVTTFRFLCWTTMPFFETKKTSFLLPKNEREEEKRSQRGRRRNHLSSSKTGIQSLFIICIYFLLVCARGAGKMREKERKKKKEKKVTYA